MTTLSISIVSSNNRKLLCECLESIYETLGSLSCEIFVVLNASHDGSERAVRLRFPKVNLIVFPGAHGFGFSHNQVLTQARSKYVLVLNDDTLIRPGALSRMVEFMERSPRAGILGCRILYPDLSLQWSAGRSFSHKFEYFRSGVLKNLFPFVVRERHFREATEVSWVTGACLLARTGVLGEIGVFDERITRYYEDGDLCYRAIRAGWKVMFYPEAEVIHYLGQTRRRHLQREVLITFESACYFFSKHYSRLAAMLIRAVLLLTALARCGAYLAWHRTAQRRELLEGYSRSVRFLIGLPGNSRATQACETKSAVA